MFLKKHFSKSIFLSVLLVFPLIGENGDIKGEPLPTSKDAVNAVSNPIMVSIERKTITGVNKNDTIMIILSSPLYKIAGFDLKIATNNEFFKIIDVLPGEIYDSCQWDFFNAHKLKTTDKENYPRDIWKIVALAEMFSDTVKPLCYGLSYPASLVKLVFTSNLISQIPDTIIPVFFFWEYCSDNTIAGVSGDTLFLSSEVIEFYKPDINIKGNPFPTLKGSPKSCIKAGFKNRPLRLIKFQNGGIIVKNQSRIDSSNSQGE
ncbi:MAG: hypothetical protein GXO93_02125 [FCB group bacterium]|nr:hypothetical protein [FCB group bacterium]